MFSKYICFVPSCICSWSSSISSGSTSVLDRSGLFELSCSEKLGDCLRSFLAGDIIPFNLDPVGLGFHVLDLARGFLSHVFILLGVSPCFSRVSVPFGMRIYHSKPQNSKLFLRHYEDKYRQSFCPMICTHSETNMLRQEFLYRNTNWGWQKKPAHATIY